MIDAVCVEITTVSKIKVEENGKSVVIVNQDRVEHAKITVDGCVDFEGSRADFVIEKGKDAVVVELKGRNVEHGADQVIATAKRWIDQECRCDRICGLIVAIQYPKASTAIQIRQNRFRRKFNAPLHVVTRNAEYNFHDIFSFHGPFRS